MAKRSKQNTMYQPSTPMKRRPLSGKTTNGKSSANKAANKSTSRPVSKQAHTGAARSYSRSTPSASQVAGGTNLQLVRIVAIVVALAAVIGGTAWALSLKGAYGAGQVAGLVILGLITGISIAVGLRTEDVVSRAAMYLRRLK